MTNLSDTTYYFYDAKLVSVDGEEIDSDSIDYEIIGLTKSRNTTIGTELIPGGTVDFKIKFKYKDAVIPNNSNNKLNAIIKFEYKQVYNITYENFEDASNYPKKVIDDGTIDIQFDLNEGYMGIKVISDGKLLIRDSIYTYNDSNFHMENVKSSLEITKTMGYPGVEDGLTSFAIRENSNSSNFGYYNSYFNNELQYSEDGALICDGTTLVRTMVNQKDFNESYSISVTVNGDTDQGDNSGYSAAIIAIADSKIAGNFICFMGFYKNYLVCYSFYVGDGKQKNQNFLDDIGFSSIDISEYSNKTMNIQVTSTKGGETNIYINGKLKKNNISGNSEVIFDSINIGDLRPNRKEYFLGKIYDVATYNKILTKEEINENWLKARDRYNIKYE